MAESNDKYVKTIRELLKLQEEDLSIEAVEDSSLAAELPQDLPVQEAVEDAPEIEAEPQTIEEIVSAGKAETEDSGTTDMLEPTDMADSDLPDEVDTDGLKSRTQIVLAKNYVRYPVIFLAALLFFYVIFNFGAVSLQVSSIFSPPKDNQTVVLAEDLTEYNTWISKYYYYSSDQEMLAANNDPDGDGLSNIEEFKLNTNPFLPDTDSDGFDDGQELINGYNPLYSGFLTQGQSKAASQDIDLATVQSRKNFALNSAVAGQAIQADGFIVNTNREGRLTIAKLGVDAPLVWNKNFEWIQDDLKSGVVHHPKTVLPGQRGMSSIHGHSSGYVWDGDYKNVFTRINRLEPGDEVFITVVGLSGETRSYRYIVRSKAVFEVEDQAQFADQGGYNLNLSTSWPVGSARQRFVVTTELAGL